MLQKYRGHHHLCSNRLQEQNLKYVQLQEQLKCSTEPPEKGIFYSAQHKASVTHHLKHTAITFNFAASRSGWSSGAILRCEGSKCLVWFSRCWLSSVCFICIDISLWWFLLFCVAALVFYLPFSFCPFSLSVSVK